VIVMRGALRVRDELRHGRHERCAGSPQPPEDGAQTAGPLSLLSGRQVN